MRTPLFLLATLAACQAPTVSQTDDSDVVDTDATDAVETDVADTDVVHTDPTDASDTDPTDLPAYDAFADAVHSFTPGGSATFGADKMPGIVLGPPQGSEGGGGSLDVVSLGKDGSIVLTFTDFGVVDGDGVDLLVFENPFTGWMETGIVAISDDGVTWHSWPCAATDSDGGFPGCAGVTPVRSNPTNGISPTDPSVAGGDGFDLADLGLPDTFVGTYVRITDSGENDLNGIGYGHRSGGFDLDAVAVVHGELLPN